jgi:hypothetical protein
MVRLDRGRGGAHFHRPGAALNVALHVDTHVGGDAIKPRPYARTPLELSRHYARRAALPPWTASSASKPEPSIR